MMTKSTVFSLGALLTITICTGVSAKTFRNSYVSFDLADRWNCTLEQTEWVCRTASGPTDNREAIIILTAKEVGPSDSLPLYIQHLKTPRSVFARTGQAIQSRILKVEQRIINKHPWIDGMHEASEIPNYFTRYLATTKDKIAVLVTFSAHKSHYAKYSQDFFRAIESLRVIATKNLMGGAGNGSGVGIPGSDILGSGSMGGGFGDDELPQEGSGGRMNPVTQGAIALAILLLAGGLYMILGKKKKKPTKKRH